MSRSGADDGFRNNLPLSRAHKSIRTPGVHAIDIDLVSYHSACRRPVVFIEATSSSNKSTHINRIIASMCNAYTLLLRHSFDDRDHEYEISMYLWEPGRTKNQDPPDRELVNVPWSKFTDTINWLHRIHEC